NTRDRAPLKQSVPTGPTRSGQADTLTSGIELQLFSYDTPLFKGHAMNWDVPEPTCSHQRHLTISSASGPWSSPGSVGTRIPTGGSGRDGDPLLISRRPGIPSRSRAVPGERGSDPP